MYTEVSSFQEVTVYRGVLISGGHGIQRCAHFRRSLYTEVSSFLFGVVLELCISEGLNRRVPLYTSERVGIEGVHIGHICVLIIR